MIEWFTSLFIALLILAQAFFIRNIVGTWMFPAAFYSLFWSVLTIIPMIVAPYVTADPLAVLYIFAACTLFSIGSVGKQWGHAYAAAASTNASVEYGTPFLKQILILVSLLAIAGHIANMVIQGFSLDQIASNLFETAGAYTELRYNENLIQNIFGQIAIVLTYVAAIIGGLLFLSKQDLFRTGWVLSLSFLPSILLVAAQSAKGALFLCVALFVGGSIVYYLRSNERRKVSHSTLVYLLAFSSLGVLAVVFSFAARLGDARSSDYLIRYITSYSSAHIFAFSDWFAWYHKGRSIFLYDSIAPANGFYTFMTLFRMMGDARFVPLGTYSEYFDYSFYLTGNIYTMYRGLIIDFGIFGSLIFILAFSFVSNSIFYKMLLEKRSYFPVAYVVILVGFIYHTYLSSLLMYFSVYVTLFVVYGILWVNGLLFKRSSRHSNLGLY